MKARLRLLLIFFAGVLGLGLLVLTVPQTTGQVAQLETNRTALPEQNSDHLVVGANGIVVSVSSPASEVGLSILKQKGNAVDAAIATAFALAVTYPGAGNLGGGGFMLVHPAPGDGEPIAIDYRESAPAAAKRAMYTREDSQFSHKAVATPGTVRGLALAHQRFGSLPWSQLVQPAVTLAREGFLLDVNLVNSLNYTLTAARDFPEFQRVFGRPGGGLWKPGERLCEGLGPLVAENDTRDGGGHAPSQL